ncbi:MAG: phosphoethanolamine transferase [Prevotella sp.]|nr:phosphoethanolamine transferase [Prevotella sp.]
MKTMNWLARALGMMWEPIRLNGAFFLFMYTLGIVCTYVVVPDVKGAHAYSYAWQELFVDVYLLCVLLSLLPSRVRLWVRRLFYVVAYSLAIIDVYCFVKFDSTITPTMLLLVGETNGQEAGEFLASYLSADLVFSQLGWVLLVLLVHVLWNLMMHLSQKRERLKAVVGRIITAYPSSQRAKAIAGMAVIALFAYCATACWHNKVAYHRLLSYDNIGDVEHELTEKTRAVQYQPVYRLLFSIYANRLTSRQVAQLVKGIDRVQVDSCSFRSPHIVLVIGESFNRHHAQLYGYGKPNMPRQTARARKGEIIPYSDVVAPWNLTSFVFKHIFSLYTVGDKGEWCDYPLFPELFRKAGYHVTFLTNQFLPQAKEAVYDFSGGFFLNNPELSNAMFDTRNKQLYYFDEGMLREYDRLKKENTAHNLTIIHLKGMHVDYRTRCPKSKMHFKRDDYERPGYNSREKQVMAYYDNAILYNDSIMDQIIQRFENDDAIVLYLPDHGEECYEGDLHFFGRMHSAEVTARLAHAEFDIPFWIYCSHQYMVSHPEVYSEVVKAKDRRFMTDALPHMLLYLAGISTKDYREELNILSDRYQENRPRILKNQVDYDKLEEPQGASDVQQMIKWMK